MEIITLALCIFFSFLGLLCFLSYNSSKGDSEKYSMALGFSVSAIYLMGYFVINVVSSVLFYFISLI